MSYKSLMLYRVPLVIGLLSFAILGYQLSLMRILSYAQWYHFAYMIISVALLGFGASGTVIALFRERLTRNYPAVVLAGSLLCALLIACSPALLSLVSIDPFLMLSKPSHLWQLVLVYLIIFLPFFAAAMVIGLSFVVFPDAVGRLYFFNLAGSGLGSFAAVVLMQWIHPHSMPLVMAVIALPAVWLIGTTARWRIILTLVTILALAAVAIWQPVVPMSQYKSLSRTSLLPDARVTHRSISPLGALEVVESQALRYAPGVSLNYRGAIPAQPGVFNDGEWIGSMIDARDSSAFAVLRHSTSSLPYRIGNTSRVLVVGSGAGSELLLARAYEAETIVGIEMNRRLVELVEQKHRFADGENRGAMIVAEARSYLARDTSLYDLIIVPILEGQTASAAGTQALFENYLFTVESFQTMLNRLSDGGMLVIHTWMTFPPRAPMKVITTMFRALRNAGIEQPAQNIVAIRSWGAFTALAARSPLTPEQMQAVRTFCDTLGFDLAYLPNIRQDEVNRHHQLDRPYLYDAAMALIEGSEEALYRAYPFHIAPATDDRPYFSHFVRWESVPYLMRTYGSRETPFFELGYFLLIVTLAQLVVLSFILIVLPLLLRRKERSPRRSMARTLLYFGAIGIGYMIVEIVMIQKFILFLGHPIYSVSTIIAVLLISSGIGSAVSGRIAAFRPNILKIALIGIVALLSLYAVALPSILSGLLQFDFGWRLFLTALLIAPAGFLMGFPFPLGLTKFARISPSLVPWGWGINGYCSVVSASLAVLIAMEFGFSLLLFAAMIAYIVAFIVSVRLAPKRNISGLANERALT